MKRLISFILALSMLTIPVYGEENNRKEELIEEVKSICQIDSDYTEFNINSTYEYSGITFYEMRWSPEKSNNSIGAVIGNDNILYSYNLYKNENTTSKKIYTNIEGKKTAEDFLTRALKEKYSELEYSNFYNYTDSYEYLYSVNFNGIPYLDYYVTVSVNKFNNTVTSYYYPDELIRVMPSNFQNTKSLSDAENSVKDNMQLGYKTDYDYTSKTYSLKLLYRLKDYILKAEDLTPLPDSVLYAKGRNAYTTEASADTGSNTLTPAEISEIENLNNTITVDEALTIFNKAFNRNIDKSQVSVNYFKDNITNTYNISLASTLEDNSFNCTIDAQKRIINYYTYNNYDDITLITEKEAAETAKEVLGKINCNYEHTDLRTQNYDDYTYNFNCNLLRNNIISFDETIEITISKDGTLSSLCVNYLPDTVFTENTITAEYTADTAYNLLCDKFELKPYYYINTIYTDNTIIYESIPVYGFNTTASVNAVTGEVVDFLGNPLSNYEIKMYTDLSDQWYAESAQNLAYLGYAFSSDEFKGDEYLTYGAFKEIGNYTYYSDEIIEGKEENDTITRYEFAEYLIDSLSIKDVNTYNEIYIKPFDDVDYKYTGTLAILKAMGVVSGDTYRGNDNITRGEAAAMIYSLITL